jgi:hypothetical protein
MPGDRATRDAPRNANPRTGGKKVSLSPVLKRGRSTQARTTSVQAETPQPPGTNAVREEEIRVRAYEIYLERGAEAGRELDDWLQAEHELDGGEPSRA